MATTEQSKEDFVIDLKANAVLSRLSREFAEAILHLAAMQPSGRTSKNVPVVTVCDIESAAASFCNALRDAIKQGAIPKPEGEKLLSSLREFCDVASRE